jgi:nucleotide-binding universal stress UspA family protein
MFETIIVGIDGRPQDAEALALARQLADPGAEIIAITVAVTVADLLHGKTRGSDAAEETVDAFTDAHTSLEGVVVEAASVGEGLRAAADGASADLIVVASSRRGMVGRIFAGDSVRAVVDHAPCPVAVATHGYHRTGPLRQITVGYDGSAAADRAIEEAVRIGKRDHASVSVVDVVEPALAVAAMTGAYVGNALEDTYALARKNLDRLKEEHGLHGVVATGQPGHELAEASRGADLLAIGLHHHATAERILVGSAGSSLLTHHSAPLLIVPATAAGQHPPVTDALDSVPAA